MSNAVQSKCGGEWDPVELVVLWRVFRTLEEIKHLGGHNETTKNIHSRDTCGEGSECLCSCAWEKSTSHHIETSRSSHARNGVGHCHKRGVQCVGDPPDDLVTNDGRESKSGEHASEAV